MPSPFPGMDPYIENQVWEDFHHEFIAVARETLSARVRPRYVVRVEKRVYVEHGLDKQKRESFLTVRDRESMQVVTIIELLSPSNKRAGGDGRREYLSKREAVVQSATHLVEIDLLRGGDRMPTVERLLPGDYYVFVSRGQQRPSVEVYRWAVRQPIPSLPIPLAGQDPDVALDLQTVFQTVYDRAGYDYSLDYRGAIDPPLSRPDAAWAQQVLGTAKVDPR